MKRSKLVARLWSCLLGFIAMPAHAALKVAGEPTTQFAFGITLTVATLVLFAGITLRRRLPVLIALLCVTSALFLAVSLGLKNYAFVESLRLFLLLVLSVIAIELSLILREVPFRRRVVKHIRLLQAIALGLACLVLLRSDNGAIFALGYTLATAVFTWLAVHAAHVAVTSRRFAVYVALGWSLLSITLISIGVNSLKANAPMLQAFHAPVSAFNLILAVSILFLTLGLMHKTMRSQSTWAKELAASKKTDRMLVLERSQREFSQEVERFLGTVSPNDFEEVVLSSFLSHLDRVISVAASAVAVSHRGQVRLVTRFPHGNNDNFASMLATREALLQSVCLSDRAAVLHSDDIGLHVGDSPVSTLCVVPVNASRNDWAGVILARTFEEDFQLEELLLVKRFAEHVQTAMESASKFNRIRRQAETDVLTGLMNRRAVMARAERAFRKARSMKQKLSFLFIDIDNFKKVNDTYGHEVGDRALFKVGEVCQTSLRDEDKVGRYGGEEFVAILPGTGENHANLVAERIRKSVADSSVRVDGSELELTVSVGISELSPHFNSVQEMIAAADRALYAAKRDGRNRVVHHLRIVNRSSEAK